MIILARFLNNNKTLEKIMERAMLDVKTI